MSVQGDLLPGRDIGCIRRRWKRRVLCRSGRKQWKMKISYRQSSSRIFTRKQLCQWKINGFTDTKELILLELRGHSITISVRESFWREEARLLSRWQKISILTWIKQLSGRLPRYLWQLRWKKNLQKRRF